MDPVLREKFHMKYKNYRNLLSTPMRKSKQNCYNKFFETTWNNIKNSWKGIKSQKCNFEYTSSTIP